jgi:hypothetical protein
VQILQEGAQTLTLLQNSNTLLKVRKALLQGIHERGVRWISGKI